ncbi:Transcriptional activator protein acu-15 [Ophiocordyceps camponoti-floridani]|uniref:Transcriptional activator protein acu-15 n=1 Tax=Ophiocordyceps camponoti-floridani TaxID=2030778 RepID=A0A8H4VGI8_9HYPO|nr:Transcriptional activator protein acu-15 [Ophiocordyceps camponoti-floridani]
MVTTRRSDEDDGAGISVRAPGSGWVGDRGGSKTGVDPKSGPICPRAQQPPGRGDCLPLPSPSLPQTIAHRGAKAHAKENTLAAFRLAASSGAHAIETDARLSGDGVAVLAHDLGLERCFGRGCGDLRADELKALGAGMWVLLDIKMDDDPVLLLAAIKRAVDEVPSGKTAWEKRIVLGCWNASTLLAARRLLPSHATAHIGTSHRYAQTFTAKLPTLALNLAYTAVPPKTSQPLYAWTVNDEATMRWALRHPCVDAVVTDDPARFRALCARVEDELAGRVAARSMGVWASLAWRWDWACVRVWHRLVFCYRRFWLRKLDLLR